ncbi:alpha-galactosidase [Intrasporangium calvum]|uniref:Alpha-galactosidase n=1 Tax=Intrasporangium calvum TaxID=53358 RepID=A0ABT5GG05_9MICO|nr:alpha-galactosidase [Intrasporangium calvum]MDC5696631.1 alpha-galactosidase [Intrasporangium calvum]
MAELRLDRRHEHLRAGGTSVVVEVGPDTVPRVLHWGADLGDLDDAALAALGDAVRPTTGDSVVTHQTSVPLVPQHGTGWLGRPGITGNRVVDGRPGPGWSPLFTSVQHARADSETVCRLVSEGTDPVNELVLTTELEVHPSGLVRARAALRNDGATPYALGLLECALPVPAVADELLHLTGHHTRERIPQRQPFTVGQLVREARSGRPGHDATTVIAAGVPGFGWRSGRVWSVHVAWNGNQVSVAERTDGGWRLLRGSELLLPGEVVLAPGETYTAPWLVASWGDGLDELAGRHHDFLRARPQHPTRPRPVLLNTWEAVYFDHDLDRLTALAEAGAEVGVDRFVLDDGWFRGRRNDRAGLGDWFVDEAVWPDGLRPLVDRVHALGMEFGLWFEPEMVNLDSDLARAHPDWLLGVGRGAGPESRYQHVLDLSKDEVVTYVTERMSQLIGELDIAYIKWDHNRALVDAGSQPTGIAVGHANAHAVQAVMAELKQRHPGLEIESCCGGGGRIDLGIIEFADRVWASDCIDAHDRLDIQRGTNLLLPPELVGTHIGSPRAHTTGRVQPLSLRGGVALWGHLGIEWDLTRASAEDRAEVAEWVALHKALRPLLHTGRLVHADLSGDAFRLEGVVADDGSRGVYGLAAYDRPLTSSYGRMPLGGLRDDVTYRVTLLPPGGRASVGRRPVWLDSPVALPGRVLREVGLEVPMLLPDGYLLIDATAT